MGQEYFIEIGGSCEKAAVNVIEYLLMKSIFHLEDACTIAKYNDDYKLGLATGYYLSAHNIAGRFQLFAYRDQFSKEMEVTLYGIEESDD
ncbi:MAG: hypothetical protein AB1815_06300 [Bacillota bacterium]